MRVLVCGGRDFDDLPTLSLWLGSLPITLIIEGGAPGADFMARTFAMAREIPVKTFPADWNKYGRGAGPIRNRQMLVEGKPDVVVAFEGGRGTANMVQQANDAGIRVVIATKMALTKS